MAGKWLIGEKKKDGSSSLSFVHRAAWTAQFSVECSWVHSPSVLRCLCHREAGQQGGIESAHQEGPG